MERFCAAQRLSWAFLAAPLASLEAAGEPTTFLPVLRSIPGRLR
ncbi:MAG: hypothetical protein ABSH53_15080 [Holophaga sp.]